jgi:hypothetical protein
MLVGAGSVFCFISNILLMHTRNDDCENTARAVSSQTQRHHMCLDGDVDTNWRYSGWIEQMIDCVMIHITPSPLCLPATLWGSFGALPCYE